VKFAIQQYATVLGFDMVQYVALMSYYQRGTAIALNVTLYLARDKPQAFNIHARVRLVQKQKLGLQKNQLQNLGAFSFSAGEAHVNVPVQELIEPERIYERFLLSAEIFSGTLA
jgi:hypothetical protein